jgi:hypothetical protein
VCARHDDNVNKALQPERLGCIFAYLSIATYARVSAVCSVWNGACGARSGRTLLWQELFLRVCGAGRAKRFAPSAAERALIPVDAHVDAWRRAVDWRARLYEHRPLGVLQLVPNSARRGAPRTDRGGHLPVNIQSTAPMFDVLVRKRAPVRRSALAASAKSTAERDAAAAARAAAPAVPTVLLIDAAGPSSSAAAAAAAVGDGGADAPAPAKRGKPTAPAGGATGTRRSARVQAVAAAAARAVSVQSASSADAAAAAAASAPASAASSSSSSSAPAVAPSAAAGTATAAAAWASAPATPPSIQLPWLRIFAGDRVCIGRKPVGFGAAAGECRWAPNLIRVSS